SNRSTKKGSHHQNAMMRTLFHYFWLVMSQPLFYKVMVEKVTKKYVMFSDIFAVEFIYLV
ncbi:hypothetical protein, partial [Priestia flexa]|uniref:hypothetical protein n=1 Tax=Priestia flexa TaxID=86664 RepID=UPI001954A01A